MKFRILPLRNRQYIHSYKCIYSTIRHFGRVVKAQDCYAWLLGVNQLSCLFGVVSSNLTGVGISFFFFLFPIPSSLLFFSFIFFFLFLLFFLLICFIYNNYRVIRIAFSNHPYDQYTPLLGLLNVLLWYMQVGAKYSNEQCPNARLNTVMVRKKKIIIRKGWMVSTKLKKIQSPTETGSAATQNLALYNTKNNWRLDNEGTLSRFCYHMVWQGRMMYSTSYRNVCWDQIISFYCVYFFLTS